VRDIFQVSGKRKRGKRFYSLAPPGNGVGFEPTTFRHYRTAALSLFELPIFLSRGDDENRTRVICLEDRSFTIKLHPRYCNGFPSNRYNYTPSKACCQLNRKTLLDGSEDQLFQAFRGGLDVGFRLNPQGLLKLLTLKPLD
jgi:hypothetical protein